MGGMERNGKARIVFVLSGYGRVHRGAEHFTESLVRALGGEFDIRVLGSGTDAPGAVPLRFPTRDAKWANWLNRCPGIGHGLRCFQLDPLNWEWLFCARAARRWLEENPCDLLVVEGGKWGAALGRWAHGKWNVPVVDVAHGAPSRWEVASARAMPQAYVSPTAATAVAMRKAVPGLRAEVIPFGIDLAHFREDGEKKELGLERPVTLAVGALEPLKHVEKIIEGVAARGKGSVVVLGRGPQKAELERLGRERLGEGRFFLGAVGQEELPAWYRGADVYAQASGSEAFSLTILEAMACGLPVVTTGDAARREQWGAGAEFVEESGGAAEWAEGIGRALAGQEAKAAARRALAEEHDVRRMCGRFRELFLRLMGEFPRRG